MSHLNIASFVASNSSKIENTILLPSENSNASIVVTGKGVVAAMENNDAIIAPLQAFFIKKKAGSSAISVTFNASDFTTDNSGSHQLKSSESSRFDIAKNSTPEQYTKATEFEALIGYWYLTEQYDKVESLIKTSVEMYYDSGRN